MGTNSSVGENSGVILNKLLLLKSYIEKELPECKVFLSNVIQRTDDTSFQTVINDLNNLLGSLNLEIIDNSNIKAQHLEKKGLHLNHHGTGRLALNFMKILKKINSKNCKTHWLSKCVRESDRSVSKDSHYNSCNLIQFDNVSNRNIKSSENSFKESQNQYSSQIQSIIFESDRIETISNNVSLHELSFEKLILNHQDDIPNNTLNKSKSIDVDLETREDILQNARIKNPNRIILSHLNINSLRISLSFYKNY